MDKLESVDKVWAVGLWVTELCQAGWEAGLRRDIDGQCWAVAMKDGAYLKIRMTHLIRFSRKCAR